jgi:hypothetical protein
MTPEQIPSLLYRTSAYQRQPLSPWTETASSSKSKGSSLASARGLRWWQVVAARVDLQSLAWQQRRQWDGNTKQIYSSGCHISGMKNTKGFGVYL